MSPPMTAPMTGITQKNQSWLTAQSPWKMATALERAGLTEVLVTGMETRWMRVRARPMARGRILPGQACQWRRR